jgi:thymidylate synthase (FAD)
MTTLPGEQIKILDHGYVQLVDVMGGDQDIVDAARLSVSGENVKSVQSNEGLIRYLLRNRHTTPFEMVEFKFRCKMPIFVARQWVRHRTASLNEMSARYSELPAEFYVPEVGDIQEQATKNKQGRDDGAMDNAKYHQDLFQSEAEVGFVHYKNRLQDGMAREIARNNLPLSTYTVWVWKMDLHNLFHFLGLRAHPHAQMEIRVYAEAMCEMVKERCPIAYQAFEDYRLNAAFLTKQDQEAIRHILTHHNQGFDADIAGVVDLFPTSREYEEFKTKWKKIMSSHG